MVWAFTEVRAESERLARLKFEPERRQSDRQFRKERRTNLLGPGPLAVHPILISPQNQTFQCPREPVQDPVIGNAEFRIPLPLRPLVMPLMAGADRLDDERRRNQYARPPRVG